MHDLYAICMTNGLLGSALDFAVVRMISPPLQFLFGLGIIEVSGE